MVPGVNLIMVSPEFVPLRLSYMAKMFSLKGQVTLSYHILSLIRPSYSVVRDICSRSVSCLT